MTAEHRPYAGGSIPENYERQLVPLLFIDYAADLAARVDVPDGGAVLETACGTGALTRHLVDVLPDNVKLTVTDLAEPMVDKVRKSLADSRELDLRTADAIDLPFDAATFDAVICQFSLMLFPDRWKGMAEAARVLRPGGTFIFNVWDRLENNGFSKAVHEAMEEVLPVDPPRFLEVPFAYNDLTDITRGLQAGGFGEVEIVVQPRESRASDARQVAAGLVAGSPLANEITARGVKSVDEVTDAVERIIEREFGSGPISAPMQAFQISAILSG
jgi:SAM-dependent methyltransferase